MSTQININPNITARWAGLFYFLLIPLGIVGIIYVPETLYIFNDPVQNAKNILEHETLFRLSIFSALLVQLLNFITVILLYKLLKVVDLNIAKLMVLFILMAVPVAMLNELNKAAVLILLSESEFIHALAPHEINTLVIFFLRLHEYGVHIAGIFWGLWLFPMGYLILKSGFIPRFIGLLLMIGCFGYLIDSTIFLLFPTLDIKVSPYTFWGEITIVFWLLIKGVNPQAWKEHLKLD